MQVQTTYLGTPEDIEAAMSRVVARLIERIRELEILAGSMKHLYMTKEAGERTGYSGDIICRWIREGAKSRKGKTVYLKAKEITKGDYRITPVDLAAFLAHF